MRIAVPAETHSGEGRVAATPETIKKYLSYGADVAVEHGAGIKSGIPDRDYEAAGAKLVAKDDPALKEADIILRVRRPVQDELQGMKRGAFVVAIMDPYGNEAELEHFAHAGVDAFAMELMPRITRAQSMDVLSSQANLAGYRAVIEAATEYGRALPMMMTAAGTVPAAKIFVMGVGVAGLQALATAHRLGAIVTATDVRPATKEQVQSVGAKFIAVENEEFKQAETAGGYAKEMSADYKKKQAELVASHIAKQDIVITTALIPGRPAPKLITAEMVKSMRPGSVIIDLAVERGGNCELAKPGEIVEVDGVKIVGHLNVAGRLAATASSLYAKNLMAFVETMIDKQTKALAVKDDDQLIMATRLSHDGRLVHPDFGGGKPTNEGMPAGGPASGNDAGPRAKSESGAQAQGATAPAQVAHPEAASAEPANIPLGSADADHANSDRDHRDHGNAAATEPGRAEPTPDKTGQPANQAPPAHPTVTPETDGKASEPPSLTEDPTPSDTRH